jgi:hydroxymethylbilane synthase
MKKNIVIGSRGSPLAIVQAQFVQRQLAELNPKARFSLLGITTEGDRNKELSLDKIPGMGIFVSEVQKALVEGKIDLAVHSLKDLPVQAQNGLSIGAIIQRLDPRDVLVSHSKKLKELPPNSVIGTGSQRRTAQLFGLRSDLRVKAIRGNIHTRLDKVTGGEVDGVIVAAAAMKRLGLEEKITEYLSPEHFLPSPGQGALAVEVRENDSDAKKIVLPLNHKVSRVCVEAERAFLQFTGGGCTSPIACLGIVTDDVLILQGMLGSPDHLFYASMRGKIPSFIYTAKKLAEKLLEMDANSPEKKI